MKTSLNEAAMLDAVYAHSAITAYVAEAPGSYAANIITPAQAPAMRRLLHEAFIVAIARIGYDYCIVNDGSGDYSLEVPDDAPLDIVSITAIISTATSMLAVAIVLGVMNDSRASALSDVALSMLDNLNCRRYSTCLRSPCDGLRAC